MSPEGLIIGLDGVIVSGLEREFINFTEFLRRRFEMLVERCRGIIKVRPITLFDEEKFSASQGGAI